MIRLVPGQFPIAIRFSLWKPCRVAWLDRPDHKVQRVIPVPLDRKVSRVIPVRPDRQVRKV